jgi:hypothetical protein
MLARVLSEALTRIMSAVKQGDPLPRRQFQGRKQETHAESSSAEIPWHDAGNSR